MAWVLAERGEWAEATKLLELANRSAITAQSRSEHWFDRKATAVLVEWNTFAGEAAYAELHGELAALRATNRLRARHARALLAVGRIQAGRHEFGAAGVSLARAIRLLPPTDFVTRALARCELAFVRYRHGDWRGARHDSEHVAADLGDAKSIRLSAARAAALAIWPALSGDFVLAHRLVEDARSALLNEPSVTAEIVLLHARIALAIGAKQWESMLRLLEEAAEQGYRRMYSDQEWVALWAIPLRNSGALDRYRQHVQTWSRDAAAQTTPYYWAHRGLLAQIDGDSASALAFAVRANECISPSDDPLGRGWTRIVVGTLTSLYGDPVAGMEFYEIARAEFEEIDAQGFVRICTDILRATSRELSNKEVMPLASLTQQQRKVAELVAEGYTSAEMARMLYLSKKTVDFHVANIVSRLGLINRRELRRFLRAPILGVSPVGGEGPC